LTALFSSGCASGRLTDAARRAAVAKEVSDAFDAGVKAGRTMASLPPLPADCRRAEPLTVMVGERLDVAAVKLSVARKAANARVERCARLYDAIAEKRKPVP